ncbi:MAG TPA: threonine synthase [Pseudonocardiaceae bacterium]
MYSGLTHLECSRCANRHDAWVPQNLCSCGGPLLARYDLDAVRAAVTPADFARRPPTLWRYHELLPVCAPQAVVTLGELMTPLLPLPSLGRDMGLPRLLLKDEAALPTGSFKARGAAVGVSRAAELGVTAIGMPTNGNAGASWSAYTARAGIRSLVVMPADAPEICRAECALAGAELYLVDGLISDAGRIARSAVRRRGWFEAATMREPYRVEGKKTMALEIVEQLGWRLPDVIVYPTGGGVGLVGIAKALSELAALGWASGPAPRLVAVQSTGCAPIVRAYLAGAAEAEPWQGAATVAFGLAVPSTIGDRLVLDAVRRSGGTALAVEDSATVAEQASCLRLDGVLVCPEGAAALAAVRALRADGRLDADEQVVVLNTGSGLKYQHTLLPVEAPLLAADGEIS